MALKTFNPIGLPIDVQYDTDQARKEIHVTTWGGKDFALSADAYDGVAAFRLNGILKHQFAREVEACAGSPALYYDHNISTRAEVDGSETWITRGVAERVEGFLSDLTPKAYKGYPLTIAFAVERKSGIGVRVDGVSIDMPDSAAIMVADASQMSAIEITIRAFPQWRTYKWEGGLADPYLISNATMISNEKMMLNDGRDPEGNQAPAHPFYVRWINAYGGYDYFMFACNQRFEEKLESIETYETYNGIGQMGIAAHEASEQVSVSTGQISADQWRAIAYILRSPEVLWWSEAKQDWVAITPTKGAKVTWEAEQPTGEIELTFDLPKPQTTI